MTAPCSHVCLPAPPPAFAHPVCAPQQRALGDEFITPHLTPAVKQIILDHAPPGVQVYFGGLAPVGGVMYGITLSYLVADMTFAMFSMLSVFAYLYFDLGSLLLAAFGFFEIVLSVPLSFVIFAVLGNENVSFLQFMGIFIILGIGADDVFVFMDSYKQSLSIPDLTDEQRFHAGYQRAASAMLVTSATSGCAFFATAISPIPAVAAFGLTMGFMVIINYALVMTWFPSGVLIFHRHCCKGKELCCPAQFNKGDASSRQLNKVEKFFNGPFMDAFKKSNVRRGFLGFFMLAIGVALAVAGGNLEVTGNLPENFDKNHPFTLFRTTAQSKFPAGAGVPKIPVTVFFGIDERDPIDRTGLDAQGNVLANYANFDPDFDITSLATQLAIKELCVTIAADEELVVEQEVYCFVEDFEDFLEGKGLAHGEEEAKMIVSAEYLKFQRSLFSERFSGEKVSHAHTDGATHTHRWRHSTALLKETASSC